MYHKYSFNLLAFFNVIGSDDVRDVRCGPSSGKRWPKPMDAHNTSGAIIVLPTPSSSIGYSVESHSHTHQALLHALYSQDTYRNNF